MLVMLLGCICYAYYVDCDPLASGQVEKNDQVSDSDDVEKNFTFH